MKQYNLVNNVLGWLTFFVAAFVYCSTIEPTASFWDCPEFITTSWRWAIRLERRSSCLPPTSSHSWQAFRRRWPEWSIP